MKIIFSLLEVEMPWEMVTHEDENDLQKKNIYGNDGKFIEFEIQSIKICMNDVGWLATG